MAIWLKGLSHELHYPKEARRNPNQAPGVPNKMPSDPSKTISSKDQERSSGSGSSVGAEALLDHRMVFDLWLMSVLH